MQHLCPISTLSIGRLIHLLLICSVLLISLTPEPAHPVHAATAQLCEQPWSVPNTNLKDQTVFEFAGMYYIASISSSASDPRGGETTFAYARTADFCSWEQLGSVLGVGAPGAADDTALWAPYVLPVGGTFYMFYAGVNRNMAQSIMLATSTNPADPLSWVKQGVVFQPNHPAMVYPGPTSWSDARDPMVLPYNNRYYMYYTALDTSGGIVGQAVADTVNGPWQDLGATLNVDASTRSESPFVVPYNGNFYLYTNDQGGTTNGEVWRSAPSPFGPWQSPVTEPFGWADDFYQVGTMWYASYVIGDGTAIGFTPILWNTTTSPASPQLTWRILLPDITKK